MVDTLKEREELVSLHYKNQYSALAAARIFNQQHPERNVYQKDVMDLISIFVQTGSVVDKKRASIEIVSDEGAAMAVLGHFRLMLTLNEYDKFLQHPVLDKPRFSEFN